jgi:hypothetical protein
MLHPDASHLLADPINGIYITPMSDEWDDHCLNCAQPIRLAPTVKIEDRYWFHVHSLANNCLGKDLQ